MKRILLMGEDTYIGNMLKTFLVSWIPAKEDDNQYGVATLPIDNDKWKDVDFWVCDSVIYCAELKPGIDNDHSAEEYMRVNCDTAVAVAEKCKRDKVHHFVYLSSMDVYGIHPKIGKEAVIDSDTICRPSSNYAKSKYEAEKKLVSLADDDFRVAIVRLPIVYGQGCSGVYDIFRSYALEEKPLPAGIAKRSFIHIDNLCDYLKIFIEKRANGVFCPQNADIVSPVQLVQAIAKYHDKNVRMQGAIANATARFNTPLNELWGGCVYDDSLSSLPEMTFISLEDSIKKTERQS